MFEVSDGRFASVGSSEHPSTTCEYFLDMSKKLLIMSNVMEAVKVMINKHKKVSLPTWILASLTLTTWVGCAEDNTPNERGQQTQSIIAAAPNGRASCPDPNAQGLRFIERNPETCDRMDYECDSGVPFNSECGCGCIQSETCVAESDEVKYVSRSVDLCTRIDYECESPTPHYFSNECGCGCSAAPLP